jgi:hypothetical protein
LIDVQIDYGDSDDPVIRVLERLAAADIDFNFASMVKQWRRWGSLSPRQMLLVQWRLTENGIAHDPRCFKVSTESDKEQAQIRGLGDWQKRNLAPYLSWAQRSRFGF